MPEPRVINNQAGAPPSRPASPAPAPAAGPPVDLVVHVRPYAQRALLDGVEVASGAQAVTFHLTPDRLHTIQLEHACCVPFTRDLTADEAASLVELRVPLEARPARLRVEGDPAARVLVEGKPVGTAGDSQRTPLPVPVPSGGDNPYEASVRIGLESPGAPPRTVQVKLRAGAEVVVAAPAQEVSP